MEQQVNKSQKGFTLVEMSIVLVVIGLILGAVSIGKDLQRDAEYAKIKQKFIDGWVQAYNAYYQRTGVVLGDDQTKPRFMVNGLNYTAAGGSPVSGGNMSTLESLPGSICQGDARGEGSRAAQASGLNQNLHDLFDNLGIRMPPGRSEGREDRYVYLDSNGNPQEIQICFQWNKPTSAEGSGNVMVISGLTPDLARALDQMIDGKPDAGEGVFREQGVSLTTDGQAGVEWNANNTAREGQTYGGANEPENPENLDEDQVVTVVAIYKMNQ